MNILDIFSKSDLELISKLKTVCSLEEGSNSLAFLKYTDSIIRCTNLKNCVILNKIEHQVGDNKGNYYIKVDDPRYRFIELVEYFYLHKLYIPSRYNFKLTTFSLFELDEFDKNNIIIQFAQIGKSCKFHPYSFIGASDYCPVQSSDGTKMKMFPQLGYVKIGNNVEVFPNSIINKGALSITEIGDNTKIDALCQVGHNCKIGNNCIITAGTIIGGSTIVGNNVFIGIGSHIRNGLTIGNNVTISQGSNVVKDIPNNAIVRGNPAKIVGYNEDNYLPTRVP